LLAVIVAVATRQMPQRRLALRLDILLVIIYVERRLCRVLHPPDDDGGDFDRVAALVVDLELLPVERARPQVVPPSPPPACPQAVPFGRRSGPADCRSSRTGCPTKTRSPGPCPYTF